MFTSSMPQGDAKLRDRETKQFIGLDLLWTAAFTPERNLTMHELGAFVLVSP
jgi:hypothetical protein